MTTPSWLLLFALALPLAAHAQEDAGTDVIPDDEASTLVETSAAQTVKGKFPRYASLKKSEVNVRSGPGNQYPILWVYQRPGYPVQLLTRYDNYYKIRDAEGEEGWVYLTMVSAQRTALVAGHEGNLTIPTPLFRKQDTSGPVAARLSAGVVVVLKDDSCDAALCKVETGGYSGWVAKRDLLMVE